MKVYITPAGKTALLINNFLEKPKEEFGFDLAIMLTDNLYVTKLYEKYEDENLIIVPISNPYFGTIDYAQTVRRLVKQTLLFCQSPDLIVANSSGGTEKMTNIIKDSADILATKFKVLKVFGVFDKHTKDVVFTIKPCLDALTEIENVSNEVELILKLKEQMNACSNLDVDKRLD